MKRPVGVKSTIPSRCWCSSSRETIVIARTDTGCQFLKKGGERREQDPSGTNIRLRSCGILIAALANLVSLLVVGHHHQTLQKKLFIVIAWLFDRHTGPFSACLIRSAKMYIVLTQLLHNTRYRRSPSLWQQSRLLAVAHFSSLVIKAACWSRLHNLGAAPVLPVQQNP